MRFRAFRVDWDTLFSKIFVSAKRKTRASEASQMRSCWSDWLYQRIIKNHSQLSYCSLEIVYAVKDCDPCGRAILLLLYIKWIDIIYTNCTYIYWFFSVRHNIIIFEPFLDLFLASSKGRWYIFAQRMIETHQWWSAWSLYYVRCSHPYGFSLKKTINNFDSMSVSRSGKGVVVSQCLLWGRG